MAKRENKRKMKKNGQTLFSLSHRSHISGKRVTSKWLDTTVDRLRSQLKRVFPNLSLPENLCYKEYRTKEINKAQFEINRSKYTLVAKQ